MNQASPVDAAAVPASVVDVPTDLLTVTAGATELLALGLQARQSSLPTGCLDAGHPDVTAALNQFTQRWQTGFGVLVNQQLTLADSLRSTAAMMTGTDFTVRDRLAGLRGWTGR